MSGPLRLVLFDVDGTLVDSQHAILAAMGEAFAACGLAAPAREAVLSIVGLSLPQAMARLAPEADDGLRGRLADAYREAFFAQRSAPGGGPPSPLFPGMRALLDDLAARPEVLLGVATGKARRGLDHLCAVHGLEAHFVTRQTADLNPSKPHPAMVLAALAETGVEPRHAVMVGDTTFDVEMARAAGIPAIGVGWGYHDGAALAAAGAERVVASAPELRTALEQIWEAAW
jgi:phosphoglycolate phosphatase